jgi:nuclear transcription Y subunit beta
VHRASDKCLKEKRKTINGDDLLAAMTTLGFDEYIEPLKLYLAKYRESETQTGNKDSKKASGLPQAPSAPSMAPPSAPMMGQQPMMGMQMNPMMMNQMMMQGMQGMNPMMMQGMNPMMMQGMMGMPGGMQGMPPNPGGGGS